MAATMGEFEIAKQVAEILHRTTNWDLYYTLENPRKFKRLLDPDEIQLVKLEGKKTELALSRAMAENREFKVVLQEVELKYMVQLGTLLVEGGSVIDPVLKGLRSVVVEGKGEVCGFCQEEIEEGEEGSAMECMHRFHGFCIVQWLHRKQSYPMCRYKMQIWDEETIYH